jgi:hypothetical protein
MGSGAGDATKPSNSLIRAIVAALTAGPVQARWANKGAARIGVEKRARVRRCILSVICVVRLWSKSLGCNYILILHARIGCEMPNSLLPSAIMCFLKWKVGVARSTSSCRSLRMRLYSGCTSDMLALDKCSSTYTTCLIGDETIEQLGEPT